MDKFSFFPYISAYQEETTKSQNSLMKKAMFKGLFCVCGKKLSNPPIVLQQILLYWLTHKKLASISVRFLKKFVSVTFHCDFW